MSAKRKSEKVRRGNSHLTVYSWTHPKTGKAGWRFGWKDGDAWKYVTKTTKDAAKAAAEKVLEQQGQGLIWETLSPEAREFLEKVNSQVLPADRAAILAFINARQKSVGIKFAAERFITSKISKKGETEHLKQVKRDLESMATHFAERAVADIHHEELAEWLSLRVGTAGDARRKAIRGTLVMFWIWCRKETLVPNEEITVAQRLDGIDVGKGSKRIWTPEKFMELSRKVAIEDRAWIVLQAFCGLRPEEARPKEARQEKERGLHCEDIQWLFNSVRVPEEVAKTRAGSVPLNDCLRAWLEWAGIREGMSGPICLRNPSDVRETTRLGKELFGNEGWPKDALRHSYASYRNALLREPEKLALEMRTSVAMLNNHYDNPRAEIEGKIWFSLRPEQPICADLNAPTYRDFQFIREWHGKEDPESKKTA